MIGHAPIAATAIGGFEQQTVTGRVVLTVATEARVARLRAGQRRALGGESGTGRTAIIRPRGI